MKKTFKVFTIEIKMVLFTYRYIKLTLYLINIIQGGKNHVG